MCTINKSAHTKKFRNLFNDPRIYIYIYICFLAGVLSNLANKSTVPICLMQSSNELRISVSDSVKCKQKEVNTYTLNLQACVESSTVLVVCYRFDVEISGIWFHLDASHVSCHTDELWYNETVCLRIIHKGIYTYTYIYIIWTSCFIHVAECVKHESQSSLRPTSNIYIYIYIYIYICVCVCLSVCLSVSVCVVGGYLGSISSLMQILLNNIDSCVYFFCVCPFELPCWFYSIRCEVVNEFPITNWKPCSFCPIFGHHQERPYCKLLCVHY